ncbi:MAG: PAS domain S-box protein [Gammaproteobacteria bacterium]|nr:PAS domain S-box protein [Gammaproteobacteria bacterium]
MSVQSSYTYISTKNKIIQEMKQSSRQTIASLQKNITNLMAAYSINEYDNIIFNEIEHRSYFSIVVEDYNMGKILGKDAYISGKIQDINGKIINFDSENEEQLKRLEACYYSDKDNIISSTGKKLGTVTIYISNQSMTQELNKIIRDTIINSIVISLLLIFSLIITIRFFILKPISNIITAINHTDKEGIPSGLIPSHGSTEISTLSHTMNNMLLSIRDSKVRLDEQYDELKAREEQLKILSMATEQSPVSIIVCSPDNIIEYANPQFEKISGFEVSEVVGRSISFLFEQSEADKKQLNLLQEYLNADKKYICEITTVTSRGIEYCIQMSASAILNDNGSVSHYIYVAEDVTEFRKNEMLLRNSQKMDAVGQLTGGIAHDFNNLLGIIMGNLELLKMDLGGQPVALERIEQALAGTERGAKLTRKLLNFSRQDNQGQELTYINSFIENIHELIAKSVTAVIQVEVHLAENLWPVNIDPGDLEDAILNLSLNARDAMPEGGTLIIETANKHLDTAFVQQEHIASEGDYVMISVSDTGTGISEENRKKIFDPFFTTKEFGKGSGLGLSMVYGFVQRSGGAIRLYSEEGVGSSFHIYLRRAIEGHDAQQGEEKIELPGGEETILIVDDERSLAETAKMYLQRLGYKTLLAYSGKEAIDILSTTQDIDLVFSDVVMSGIDGFELSFEVVKKWPGLKILLTSGFSSKHAEYSNGHQQIYLTLIKGLLEKPYSIKELAFAIRRTLDE